MCVVSFFVFFAINPVDLSLPLLRIIKVLLCLRRRKYVTSHWRLAQLVIRADSVTTRLLVREGALQEGQQSNCH
jgi:hypothetical protein